LSSIGRPNLKPGMIGHRRSARAFAAGGFHSRNGDRLRPSILLLKKRFFAIPRRARFTGARSPRPLEPLGVRLEVLLFDLLCDRPILRRDGIGAEVFVHKLFVEPERAT
jgi:hypothetical protein